MKQIKFTLFKQEVLLAGYSEDDWIFKSIKKHLTFYEIDLLKYIKFILGKGQGLVLDVGANIGNHSVFMGMFTSCKVISIEANPAVFPILTENIKANNVDALCYEVGLGRQEGMFSITLPSDMGGNIGAARLHSSSDGNVRVTTLDNLTGDLPIGLRGCPIRAIKADIEGMEYEMLQGALNTLKQHEPDLFLEIGSGEMMKDIEGLIKPLGYKRIMRWAATPVWHFTLNKNATFFFYVRVYAYKVLEGIFLKNARKLISKIRNLQA